MYSVCAIEILYSVRSRSAWVQGWLGSKIRQRQVGETRRGEARHQKSIEAHGVQQPRENNGGDMEDSLIRTKRVYACIILHNIQYSTEYSTVPYRTEHTVFKECPQRRTGEGGYLLDVGTEQQLTTGCGKKEERVGPGHEGWWRVREPILGIWDVTYGVVTVVCLGLREGSIVLLLD